MEEGIPNSCLYLAIVFLEIFESNFVLNKPDKSSSDFLFSFSVSISFFKNS